MENKTKQSKKKRDGFVLSSSSFLATGLQVFFSFAVQGLRLSGPPAACHGILAADRSWVRCGNRTGQEANLGLSPSGFLSFPPLPADPSDPLPIGVADQATRRARRYYWGVGRLLPPSTSEERFAWPMTVLYVPGYGHPALSLAAGSGRRRQGLRTTGGALAEDELGWPPRAPPAPGIAWLLLRAAEVVGNLSWDPIPAGNGPPRLLSRSAVIDSSGPRSGWTDLPRGMLPTC